jgi:putative phosphonate metabolism protein
MRYAVYFTPSPDNPLTRAAQSWLGRNAFTGETVERAKPVGFTPNELHHLTHAPRRYGFHATLLAPFRLREGLTAADLSAAADSLAEQTAPFTVSGLAITRVGSFFALTPTNANDFSALASAAVDHFDGLRAPLNDAEIERRRPELLSERQRLYLHRYGYPYVKEEFRFHMTLTGSVDAQAAARIEAVLHDYFGPLVDRTIEVSAVALFAEHELGADFTVHSIHRFGTAGSRKVA